MLKINFIKKKKKKKLEDIEIKQIQENIEFKDNCFVKNILNSSTLNENFNNEMFAQQICGLNDENKYHLICYWCSQYNNEKIPFEYISFKEKI